MIIFIQAGNISEESIKRLREYMDETDFGVVIIVDSIESIRTERR
jgi:hypothetical protein